ncbi:MAG: DUF3987 domain-containing protein, partial [Ktedonobacteraceae bacterium]|nr:DUF3987 domain-containing protein [Ktedonobacteraceae bacterium]
MTPNEPENFISRPELSPAEEKAVYVYIRGLCTGQQGTRPRVGVMEPFIKRLERASRVSPEAAKKLYKEFKKNQSSFRTFLERHVHMQQSEIEAELAIQNYIHNGVPLPDQEPAAPESPGAEDTSSAEELDGKPGPLYPTILAPQDGATPTDITPRLPSSLSFPAYLANEGCSWLDKDYIPFSQLWSPRGHYIYHEAVGVWLLSTLAARRVAFNFGALQYTPLYITLVGVTTLHSKSTTAGIAQSVLKALHLDWLLSASMITPQKLLSNMSGNYVPPAYHSLSQEQRWLVEARLAFAAQMGWYYEEFGMHLDAMVQKSGAMAEFKGILRVLEDCPATYTYDTVARGTESIQQPYLALLASMTPADLRPYADVNSRFWRDGLFARFAFVTPSPHERSCARFPTGAMRIPEPVLQPLRDWHKYLGSPKVTVSQPNETLTVNRSELPTRIYELTSEVIDAFYSYETWLVNTAIELNSDWFFGNYGRLAIKTLRLATLFASLAGKRHVELTHWARAQMVTEHWRYGLHEMLQQVSAPPVSAAKQLEDRIIAFVAERHNPTAREVAQYMHESTQVIRAILES